MKTTTNEAVTEWVRKCIREDGADRAIVCDPARHSVIRSERYDIDLGCRVAVWTVCLRVASGRTMEIADCDSPAAARAHIEARCAA